MVDEFGFVLLAAGSATRMGQPKQLLDFGGVPLVRHAAMEAMASGCSPVVVVCGAQGDAIASALAGLPVLIAHNTRWEEGMGTSIQCGIQELARCAPDAKGMILSLADQPLLDRETFRLLVETQHRTGEPIVSSAYGGTVGVPVLFCREIFAQLLSLPASQGCKGVIQRNSAMAAMVDCPDALADVDTPEDYQRVLTEFAARRIVAAH